MKVKSARELSRFGSWTSDSSVCRIWVVTRRLGILRGAASIELLSSVLRFDDSGVPISLSVVLDPRTVRIPSQRLAKRFEAFGGNQGDDFGGVHFSADDFQPLVRGFKVSGVLQANGRRAPQVVSVSEVIWVSDHVATVKGSASVDLRNVGVGWLDTFPYSTNVELHFDLKMFQLAAEQAGVRGSLTAQS